MKAYEIIENKIKQLRERLQIELEHNNYTEAQKIEGGIYYLELVYMDILREGK